MSAQVMVQQPCNSRSAFPPAAIFNLIWMGRLMGHGSLIIKTHLHTNRGAAVLFKVDSSRYFEIRCAAVFSHAIYVDEFLTILSLSPNSEFILQFLVYLPILSLSPNSEFISPNSEFISLSDETLNRGPDSLWSLKIPWNFS